MKPETEQLLGTLEILDHNTFIWETEKQGELNLWNLMLSQGFVTETDIDLVFDHWQNIEIWGTPTDQKTDDYKYAPYREERQDDDWNDEIAKQRQEYYQELEKLCRTNLQNLQAYILKSSFSKPQRYNPPNFYVSMIVGKTINDNWICFLPTRTNSVVFSKNIEHFESYNKSEDMIISQVNSILRKLTPILIYDYYDGGYNETHKHQIVTGIASIKEKAIFIALQQSGIVSWKLTQVEYAGNKGRKLSQFMNQYLRYRTKCTIQLWYHYFAYEFGQTPVSDWIGTKFEAETEYNP